MAGLNQDFLIKNSVNTFGHYLSSGVDLATLFAPYNVTSVLSAINNTPIGNITPSTGSFTSLNANNNTTLSGTLAVGGHVTVEGVTSTGATGTGNIVFDTSPTISDPNISGHPTIEGVTSTGSTGTGNIVFGTSPSLSDPDITGHPTVEGVTSTGATGTGRFVFDASPTISDLTVTGHPTLEGVTSTGATGTGNIVFATNPTISTPTINVPAIIGGAINSTTVGLSSPAAAAFTTLSARGNTSLDGTLKVNGHVTVEGITSTGATGSGKFVFDNGATIENATVNTSTLSSSSILNSTVNSTSIGSTTPSTATFTTLSARGNTSLDGTLKVNGHVTLEGVTSTGATGTGNIVFDTAPSISNPAITGGTIDNTPIGNTTRSSGKFTTLDANNAVTLSPTTGTVTINPTNLGAINNTTVGLTTPAAASFTSLNATGNTTLTGTLAVGGHVTVEGVTSTGATGTGKIVFDTTPTISAPTVTGHPTIEGVTSTGATGTGNIVFSNSPQLSYPVFTNFNANSGQVGDLFVSGTLFLAGSATTINQNELIVDDPIIYLAAENPGDTFDIGFVGHNVVSSVYGHTGLLRSHGNGNPGTWYLFSSMTEEPSANNIAGAAKVIDTLVANTSGKHTGLATTAGSLSAARNIASTGDVNWSVSFNGSQDVSSSATIQSNVVSYSKIQQASARTVIGNATGSTANVAEIPASITGFAVLSATTPAAAATTIGLGTGNDVTHNSVSVSNGTQISKSQVFTASSVANASVTVPTFPKTGPYYTGKYVAHIKQTAGTNTGARATLEILTTYNAQAGTWDGTYYGIIDTTGIFSSVDVSTSGSTVDLVFTLVGANNFTVNVFATGITD